MKDQKLRDPVHFFDERGRHVSSDKQREAYIKKLEDRIRTLEAQVSALSTQNEFLKSVTDPEIVANMED